MHEKNPNQQGEFRRKNSAAPNQNAQHRPLGHVRWNQRSPRSPEYADTIYHVHPLLEAGHIAMTWPDKPNDPTQVYRAVNLV
ncbi:Fic family protein [Candidatus Symbiobacter mobilis]|uniref:Filamentation induced by cAMP protein Fic-like C-terminal domain-containing protein n=1 Tax=Candidatus Symbiobacter mobilis CR TaxID=946483 RepID=U5N8F8_9BURK|nr:hypothetical protein [Candidatus Symbiobacter mobilis]AGX87826.1 hypothetical protein Cenrod_1742 [Candidatus Symbiobacter mobilis CR]